MDIKVTDDISLSVSGGAITLLANDGTAIVDIEVDDVDTLRAKLTTAVLVAVEQQQADPCPYSHSHTRNWCGHPGCRKS